MQGLPEPHPGAPRSTMVCSSAMVGNRQSQWPLKPPVTELPSGLTQLPTPVAPPFSVLRKLVKGCPVGRGSRAAPRGLGGHAVRPWAGVVLFLPDKSRLLVRDGPVAVVLEPQGCGCGANRRRRGGRCGATRGKAAGTAEMSPRAVDGAYRAPTAFAVSSAAL